jgi:hypothetical protein
MDSPHVLKYTARARDARLIGLLTVHIGLEDIVWTDTAPLQAIQNETDPTARPYYVGTLVVPPDMRGTDASSAIIQGAFRHFKEANTLGEQQSLLFFDCADANHPWLAQYIQRVGGDPKVNPDVSPTITEQYCYSWVRDGAGVALRETSQLPANADVLDKQHYYSISIEETPQ